MENNERYDGWDISPPEAKARGEPKSRGDPARVLDDLDVFRWEPVLPQTAAEKTRQEPPRARGEPEVSPSLSAPARGESGFTLSEPAPPPSQPGEARGGPEVSLWEDYERSRRSGRRRAEPVKEREPGKKREPVKKQDPARSRGGPAKAREAPEAEKEEPARAPGRPDKGGKPVRPGDPAPPDAPPPGGEKPADGGDGPTPSRRGLGPTGYFLLRLGIVAVLAVVVFTLVLGVRIQNGMSMYPHIKDGDLLILYKLENYKAGDVVLYRDPDTGEKRLARVKARGENEIDITDAGELLVNGTPVETERFYPTMRVDEGGIQYPYHVSASGYFLLNDYRVSGHDSRLFGELQKGDLLGKVVYVFRRRGI